VRSTLVAFLRRLCAGSNMIKRASYPACSVHVCLRHSAPIHTRHVRLLAVLNSVAVFGHSAVQRYAEAIGAPRDRFLSRGLPCGGGSTQGARRGGSDHRPCSRRSGELARRCELRQRAASGRRVSGASVSSPIKARAARAGIFGVPRGGWLDRRRRGRRRSGPPCGKGTTWLGRQRLLDIRVGVAGMAGVRCMIPPREVAWARIGSAGG